MKSILIILGLSLLIPTISFAENCRTITEQNCIDYIIVIDNDGQRNECREYQTVTRIQCDSHDMNCEIKCQNICVDYILRYDSDGERRICKRHQQQCSKVCH